ncbi:MAG: MoaD/ThiS family protein [Nitrospinota bacterium]|nr:MoaD/ThiS family protein [Nitrospinota bacterium]
MQDAKSEQGVIAATIHYQGLLYRIVGKREETVSLPSVMSLGGLISSLSQRYGPEFECAVLTPAGELRPEVGILINGLNPARRGGIGCPLAQDNSCAVEIALLGSPPVGG